MKMYSFSIVAIVYHSLSSISLKPVSLLNRLERIIKYNHYCNNNNKITYTGH